MIIKISPILALWLRGREETQRGVRLLGFLDLGLSIIHKDKQEERIWRKSY